MSAMLSPKKFQFTPLREGRLLNPAEIEPMRISIHAPPRGATATAGVPSAPDPISIHAPPRGATALARRQRISETYFNSRPSARGDEISAGRDVAFWLISIHAPPRGATEEALHMCGRFLFQFTPLREGRRNREYNCFIGRNFNSRPSARGDTLNDNATPWLYLFQFTPLREGRLILPREQFKHVLFQFTPLREGRLAAQHQLIVRSYFNSRPSARGDASLCQLHCSR